MLKIVLCMRFVWSAHSNAFFKKVCVCVCVSVGVEDNKQLQNIHPHFSPAMSSQPLWTIRLCYNAVLCHAMTNRNPACRTKGHIFRSFICTSRRFQGVRQPTRGTKATTESPTGSPRPLSSAAAKTKPNWRSEASRDLPVVEDLDRESQESKGKDVHLWFQQKCIKSWTLQDCRIMISNVQQWTSNLA